MDLDRLLTREIGQFGRYQWQLLAMAVIVAIAVSCNTGEFVFTTGRINTRCLITECEAPGDTEFSPPWLANAIPFDGDTFDSCQHYAIRTPNVTSDVTTADGSCPASLFDPSVTLSCEQYVFENKDTVVYDLELACDEWRRSLIGSVRTLAMFIAFPLTGLVSDRWGRHTALIITALNGALWGTLRSRANTYTAFIIGQFVEAALGTGKFTCIYVLLLEVVGPKYRVRAGAVAFTSVALGHMVLALLAWVFPYWKNLTLAIYVPQFLFILYYWVAPESIRWYQSKGKFDKAAESIKKVARVNGKILSEIALLELKNSAEPQRNERDDDKKEDEPWLIVQVFRHKRILIRCLTSPVWFVTASLVYYGLSINAVNLVGNKYLNYALVGVVDIPGVWLAMLLMDRVGRRPVLTGAFGLCALCQLGYIFVSKEVFGVSLLMYLMGKCCISAVNATLAIYTNELYPTRYRHTMYAFSATMGSIGTTLAPLTPALGVMVSESLPFMLFGGMALLSGLLVRLVPETLGTPLPDTMQQAADIGREDSRKNEDL